MTDNGGLFTWVAFRKYLEENGIHYRASASFHPYNNGRPEHFVRLEKVHNVMIMNLGTYWQSGQLYHLAEKGAKLYSSIRLKIDV